MSRVVTLTPAALERDSRTLKQAASVARLGHESIVVEGKRSAQPPPDLPFRLLTSQSIGEGLADAGGDGAGAGVASPGGVERVAGLLGRVAGPLYFLASWTAFNLATARRLPGADAYWLHGYDQVLAVWLRRRPYVYDAHDLYAALPDETGELAGWQRRLTHRLREAIERRCIRRAAVCVTTSAPMADAYRARYGREFAVLRNAQDARLAAGTERDLRRDAGAADDDFLLVMVAQHKAGTVIPETLPDGVRLAFVGDRYPAVAPPGVAFVGSVPPEEVAAYVRGADAAALLYVPVTENSRVQLVNGLFHAVAAGLPLLVPARMDAIRDVAVEHGLGVVVDPEDPASLAAGIAELRARHDALRAAVRTAAPQLSWEREERVLAGLLERALRR